jgi:act minimal PKS acyl carrier protein
MQSLTIDELKVIMRECAGDDGGNLMDGDIADIEFGELGYDSLALLETAGRIQRQYGVMLDENLLPEMTTPGAFVRVVNDLLAQPA